ncbi:hypothetical protein ACFYRD_40925 [Streptomyces hirsutus]
MTAPLWSVLVLAHLHNVDLEHASDRTMAELDERISACLTQNTPAP